MKEVFIYEQLIKDVQCQETSLRVHNRTPSAANVGAICNFREGIKGMEYILQDCDTQSKQKKGMFQRAYRFCSDWCCAPENAQKIRLYSEKNSKATQLLGSAVVTGVEEKANGLIAQGEQLQRLQLQFE